MAKTKITLELYLWELNIIIKALRAYYPMAQGDEKLNVESLLNAISCGYDIVRL